MSEANTNICPSPQSSIEGFGGHEGFRRSLMHGLSAVFAFSQGPGLAHSGLWGNVEAAPAGTRATGLGSVSSKYQQFQRSPASCRSHAHAAPESAEWAAIRSLAGDNRTFSNTATVQRPGNSPNSLGAAVASPRRAPGRRAQACRPPSLVRRIRHRATLVASKSKSCDDRHEQGENTKMDAKGFVVPPGGGSIFAISCAQAARRRYR